MNTCANGVHMHLPIAHANGNACTRSPATSTAWLRTVHSTIVAQVPETGDPCPELSGSYFLFHVSLCG